MAKTADAIYNQHNVGSKPMPQTPANLKVEAASERAKRDYRNLQTAKGDFHKVVGQYNNLDSARKDPKEGKKIRMAGRQLRSASLRHEKSDTNYQKALSKAKLARSKQRNGLAYQLHVAKTKAEKDRVIAVNREIAKDPRIKGKEAKAIHSLLKGPSRKPRNPRQPNPFK